MELFLINEEKKIFKEKLKNQSEGSEEKWKLKRKTKNSKSLSQFVVIVMPMLFSI